MDRFVTRAPSWKTMNYSSVLAQSVNNRSTNSKLTAATQPTNNQKKPLQQKQVTEKMTKSQDFGSRLVDVFRPISASAPDNFNVNSNDSGLSISPPQLLQETAGAALAIPLKNLLLTPTKKGKVGDYVDCHPEKENDTCLTLPHTPKSTKKPQDSKVSAGLKEKTPTKQLLPQTPNANKPFAKGANIKTAEKSYTPSANPMVMTRIQRDLNSPSASVRIRALKAMGSPTKSPYTHFDIPDAEQSLNFSVQDMPDIKDVMRNVVVYVEVRSGEDNRSEGVRKVIEALGARCNLKLLRDTTHVVFKDGLLSTFKKAQQWNIPVVSILWIEACKTRNRICDPTEFAISNLDRYENPELYTKMKRFRNMAPDSEKAIVRKVGGSATKDLTPTQKTGAIKKNSTLIGSTPTSSSNTKKKTDISQFFKKLDNNNKILTNTPIAGDVDAGTPESPATQLLNRINSNCYTPLMQSKKTTTATAMTTNEKTKPQTDNLELYDDEDTEDKSPNPYKAKKALNFFQPNREAEEVAEKPSNNNANTRPKRRSSIAASAAIATPKKVDALENMEKIAATPTPVKPPRRRSMLVVAKELETNNKTAADTPSKPPRRRSLMSAEIEIKTNMTLTMTPSKNTRRRSSIHTPKNMSIETPRKDQNFKPIQEEDTNLQETENTTDDIEAIKPLKGRRTLYASKAMDMTEQSLKPHNGETTTNNNAVKENQNSTTMRRRTLYSFATMTSNSTTTTVTDNKLDSSNVTNRRATNYNSKTIQIDATSVTLDAANKETANIKIDLKTIASANITASTTSSQRRRTLYTPRKSNGKLNSEPGALGPQLSDGICITPTASNMHGKVTCSTFLESDNKVKPIETPPATVTDGKLLEEINECVTPLVFSSTRQPGTNRRRTLFDVSMDIITQRLQCINQSARRSLAPNAADNIANDVKSLETPPAAQDRRKTIVPNNDLENSLASTPHNSNAIVIDSSKNIATPDPSVSTQKKKRKLFARNEMLTPPPTLLNSSVMAKINTPISNNTPVSKTIAAAATNSQQKSVTKRRRTLVPLSQPLMSLSTLNSSEFDCDDNSSTASPIRKRRSTLDFEQIKTVQNNADLQCNVVKPKKVPILVCTNMHKEQIDVIREAVNKLSYFSLEQLVTDRTTHLVSLEPRRTMNLLRALARGLWILDYNWVLDSMEAGEWLAEETYELRDFSRAIEICRSERQAFGCRFKCELFHNLGPFYISVRCYPVTKDDLCELITLCGGRLAMGRNKARYIIGDTNPTLADKTYLTPYWVLDSITQMQLMKVHKYLCLKTD